MWRRLIRTVSWEEWFMRFAHTADLSIINWFISSFAPFRHAAREWNIWRICATTSTTSRETNTSWITLRIYCLMLAAEPTATCPSGFVRTPSTSRHPKWSSIIGSAGELSWKRRMQSTQASVLESSFRHPRRVRFSSINLQASEAERIYLSSERASKIPAP